MIDLLLKLFMSNNPVKKMPIETMLMLHFSARNKFLRKFFQRRIFYRYNCDISHAAKIDPSVQFIHPLGIVIGSDVQISKNCLIYQQVTLGSKPESAKMPKIGENTTIYGGAKVFGDITVGKNCIIGANAVITKSIPDNSVVVGANKFLAK